MGLLEAGDTSQPAVMDDSLKPALKKAEVKLTAEATLPLAEGDQDCTQQDIGIQKMKDADVDLVLLAAPNLCGASAVAAAEKAEYKPQWATYGNNTTDTVASFFSPSKANLQRRDRRLEPVQHRPGLEGGQGLHRDARRQGRPRLRAGLRPRRVRAPSSACRPS